MKKILAILLFFTSLAHEQEASTLKEHGIKKPGAFLSTWRLDKKDQFAVYTCKWSVNGNYLVCDQLVTDGLIKATTSQLLLSCVKDSY